MAAEPGGGGGGGGEKEDGSGLEGSVPANGGSAGTMGEPVVLGWGGGKGGLGEKVLDACGGGRATGVGLETCGPRGARF